MPSGRGGGRARSGTRRTVAPRAGGVGSSLGSLLGTAPRPDRGSRVRVTGDLEVRGPGGPEGADDPVVGGCRGGGLAPSPSEHVAE